MPRRVYYSMSKVILDLFWQVLMLYVFFPQTIARQLAEILLRGMCEQSYWNPLEDPPHQSPLDDPLLQASNTEDYALSRRPKVYAGEKYVLVQLYFECCA